MENTKIEWCDMTFNPWEGCAKVSPGCKNCYAEGQHKLHHAALGKGDNPGTCWGVHAPRLGKSEENWKKPLKWNREAAAAGSRRRVFCASMADVFEPQSALSAAYAGQTGTVPCGEGRTRTVRFVDIDAERLRLLRLIYDTPHLDWLLLTKRPENIMLALGAAWSHAVTANYPSDFREWLAGWGYGTPPANVWLGTSVENQEQADARIPHLLAAPAAVRFLSCEPLLGGVNLTRIPREFDGHATHFDALEGRWHPIGNFQPGYVFERLNWVIVGGESGPKARPMHPAWVRWLRDQCQEAGTAFFLKQWGQWAQCWGSQWHGLGREGTPPQLALSLTGETAGGFLGEAYAAEKEMEGWVPMQFYRDKHEAGRKIDGRTYDELPTAKKEAAQ